MNSSKFLPFLGLLLVLSLAVLADTSREKEGYVMDAEKEVNSVEATDGIEPEQGGHRCRHGCCRYSHGRCIVCCHPRKVAEKEKVTDAVVPQQYYRCGGCRCCSSCGIVYPYRCPACC